jgi:hypothetical protein
LLCRFCDARDGCYSEDESPILDGEIV